MSDYVRIKVRIYAQTDPYLASLCEDKSFRASYVIRETLRAFVRNEKIVIRALVKDVSCAKDHEVTIILHKGQDDDVLAYLDGMPGQKRNALIKDIFLLYVDVTNTTYPQPINDGKKTTKRKRKNAISGKGKADINKSKNDTISHNKRENDDALHDKHGDAPAPHSKREDDTRHEEDVDIWGMFDKL